MMAGLEALEVSRGAFMVEHAMAGIARLTNRLTALLIDIKVTTSFTRCPCKDAYCLSCPQSRIMTLFCMHNSDRCDLLDSRTLWAS